MLTLVHYCLDSQDGLDFLEDHESFDHLDRFHRIDKFGSMIVSLICKVLRVYIVLMCYAILIIPTHTFNL